MASFSHCSSTSHPSGQGRGRAPEFVCVERPVAPETWIMPFGHFRALSGDQRVLPSDWINNSPAPGAPTPALAQVGRLHSSRPLDLWGPSPFHDMSSFAIPLPISLASHLLLMHPSARMVTPGGSCIPGPAPPQPAPPRPAPARPTGLADCGPSCLDRKGNARTSRSCVGPPPGAPRPRTPLLSSQGLPAPSVAAAGLHRTQCTLHSLSGPLSGGRLQPAQSEGKSRWNVGIVHISGPPRIILVPSSSVPVLRFSPQLFTKQSRWR